MNFEELLFQGLSANEMTQPLSAIICVAIFPVNFPLQEKSCILLQLFISLSNSRQHFFHVSQTEREYIKQRQAGKIAAAKEQGIRFGAPPKERTDLYETVRTSWQKGALSARKAARRIGILHTTFLRWVKSDAGIDV